MENNNLQEIEIKEILMVLWKRRAILSIVAAAVIFIGVIGGIVLPKKVYQAQTILEVTGIKSLPNVDPERSGAIQNVLEAITNSLNMNFEAYMGDILSDEVLEKTINDLGLEEKYTVDSLKSKINVNPNKESQTISIKVNSIDPEEPSKIIEKLSANFVEYVSKKSKTNSEQTLKVVKDQTELEKEKYQDALENYEGFVTEYKSAQEYELEIEALYEQITLFKTSLNEMKVKVEGLKAAIKTNNASGNSTGGMVSRVPLEGVIYSDNTKKALDIDLSETNAKIEATEDYVKNIQEEINQAKIDYQRAELEEISIRERVNIAKESYEAFTKSYEELLTVNSLNIGEISVTTLLEPQDPIMVGANSKLKLLVIGVLGVTMGVIAAFLKEYIEYKKIKK